MGVPNNPLKFLITSRILKAVSAVLHMPYTTCNTLHNNNGTYAHFIKGRISTAFYINPQRPRFLSPHKRTTRLPHSQHPPSQHYTMKFAFALVVLISVNLSLAAPTLVSECSVSRNKASSLISYFQQSKAFLMRSNELTQRVSPAISEALEDTFRVKRSKFPDYGCVSSSTSLEVTFKPKRDPSPSTALADTFREPRRSGLPASTPIITFLEDTFREAKRTVSNEPSSTPALSDTF